MSITKKIIFSLLVFLAIACLAAIAIESQTQAIRRLYDNFILDNENHYLTCEELPPEAEVRAVLERHQDVVQTIEGVNPGNVGVDIDSLSCPDKADLVIWYATHQNRLAIERIIGSGTFFGVPFRLQNR